MHKLTIRVDSSWLCPLLLLIFGCLNLTLNLWEPEVYCFQLCFKKKTTSPTMQLPVGQKRCVLLHRALSTGSV